MTTQNQDNKKNASSVTSPRQGDNKTSQTTQEKNTNAQHKLSPKEGHEESREAGRKENQASQGTGRNHNEK